jgi:hypothetical protein
MHAVRAQPAPPQTIIIIISSRGEIHVDVGRDASKATAECIFIISPRMRIRRLKNHRKLRTKPELGRL